MQICLPVDTLEKFYYYFFWNTTIFCDETGLRVELKVDVMQVYIYPNIDSLKRVVVYFEMI